MAKRNETGIFDGFEYQYHLKDHLGNVRVTFKTEQEDPDNYLATFEDDAATKDYESTYFSRYEGFTRIRADIFNHTNSKSDGRYSVRLNRTGDEVYGLVKPLKVNPGECILARVFVKYIDSSHPVKRAKLSANWRGFWRTMPLQ